MQNPSFVFYVILTAFVFSACQKEGTLFEQIPASHTGITFSNRITENDTFNILSYEYVYNGGGVGVGDFNKDGLQDLFFTGNMVGNSLFLNQGDFSFLDITDQAGISSKDRWNSGVAVVDINNDGWLDVYVCATTHEPSARRSNRLFINKGVSASGNKNEISFSEEAAAYGIADESHTTHAAFFDYDNDGDLDLYLLVNQMDDQAVPSHFRKIASDGTSHRTDKLLRNDFDERLGHAIFTDISDEAGISIEGYGLGVNICDINRDGWKDIYVSNDYLTNDLFWINQGDRTDSSIHFQNKASTYLKHTSYSAMGNNVGDLNNDGLAEILAVDMLPEDNLRRKTMLGPNNYMFYVNNERYGYQYQYVRNTLQLNQGKSPETQEPTFSEIGMFAGISSTDWSWTPLLADFDNDGMRDIIITNGFPKDVTDRDFMEFNRDNGNLVEKERLEKMIPSIKISNYAYRNQLKKSGDLPTFEKVSKTWGLSQNSFSNGAAYADLDNDGDLDLVMNNINDSAFIYKNNLNENSEKQNNWLRVNFKGSEKNIKGLGAIVEIYYGEAEIQVWENTPYRGYLSSVETGAHFGLGTTSSLDSLVVIWQEGSRQVLSDVATNQLLELNIQDARIQETQKISHPDKTIFIDITDSLGINYTHSEGDFIDFNIQRLLLHKFSQYGPGLAVGDVNGDGLDDVYVGGAKAKHGTFLIQQTDGKFESQNLLPDGDPKQKKEEELGLLFFDADKDGDSDLYMVSGGYEFALTDTAYQDRLYLNEQGRFVLAKHALPKFLSSGSCVKAADYDRDGDLDLFVGGRILPYQYPKPVSSYLLRNDGKGNFEIVNEESAPALNEIGLISDALWTDFDQDGWVDLLLAGEWMPLQFLRNQNGTFLPHVSTELDQLTGFWNSLVSADFDLDGDIDYVAGNLGTNTLLQASKERPVSIYTGNFHGEEQRPRSQVSKNGYDAFPASYFPNEKGEWEEFPFFGKTDMERQLISVKKAYLHHRDFGLANMSEVLQKFPVVSPKAFRINHTQSMYIENLGGGKFASHSLPAAAQVAPVFAMVTGDFNGDNFPDIFINGNDYGGELGMGRYDALNGLVLLNDGEGDFVPQSLAETGVSISGDGKSLVKLLSNTGQTLLVAGQNKGPLKVFRKSKTAEQVIPLESMDCVAIIQLNNGQSYREELPYGNSFLSQSARRLFLPPNAVSYEIWNFKGEKRAGEVDVDFMSFMR